MAATPAAELSALFTSDTDDFIKGAQLVRSNLGDMDDKLDKTSDKMGKMGKSSRNSSMFVMQMSQAIQDGSFSAAGALNNLDPMIQSFDRIKASSKGAKGALKAIGSAMIGPSGIATLAIAAATVITTKFGPQIKAAFSEGSAASTAFKEKVKETKKELERFLAIDEATIFEERQIKSVEQARQALQRSQQGMDNFDSSIQNVRKRISEVGAEIGAAYQNNDFGAVKRLKQQKETLEDSLDTLITHRTQWEVINDAAKQYMDRTSQTAGMYNKMNQSGIPEPDSEGMKQYAGEVQRVSTINPYDQAKEGAKEMETVTEQAQNAQMAGMQNLDQKHREVTQRMKEQTLQLTEKQKLAANATSVFTNTIGQGFGNAVSQIVTFKGGMSGVIDGFVSFGDVAKSALRGVISSLSTAIAKAAALKGVLAIGNVLTGGAFSGVSSIAGFASKLVPFAGGGAVMGPTPALLGERGPEVVTPMKEYNQMFKQKQNVNINLTGDLGISLDELRFMLNKDQQFAQA